MQDGSLVLGGDLEMESSEYWPKGLPFPRGDRVQSRNRGDQSLLTAELLALGVAAAQASVSRTTGSLQPPGELGSAQVA